MKRKMSKLPNARNIHVFELSIINKHESYYKSINILLRRVWRYQRSRKSKKNRKHNGQKKRDDLQNITHKIKERVARTPLKTVDWTLVLLKGWQFLLHYRYLSCYYSYIPGVISREWGKDRKVLTTDGTYPRKRLNEVRDVYCLMVMNKFVML